VVQKGSGTGIRRVAFPLVGGQVGTGCYNYLLNLTRVIDVYASDRLTPVIFVGDDVPEVEVAPFRDIAATEVVRIRNLSALQSRSRLARAILLGSDAPAVAAFQESSVDAVFEQAMFFGWRLPIPVISWIPDFQHRHLRELFSAKAYWKRELGFRAQTAFNRLIMLSSEDARRDCERFYPATVGRTAVVRFAVLVDPASLTLDPASVTHQYGLPGDFFYLPNQFWKHKNHGVVIEAVRLLKQQGRDVVVAATGVAGDSRHPGYYEKLKSLVVTQGLEYNFRFLGLVPRQHVIALMRACTALINPSLFEGWSTPVEEAKTLGVPLLLSDLRVHREQLGDSAQFFDPVSPSQLAALMQTQSKASVPTRAAIERAAIDGSGSRLREFSLGFCETVQRAIGRSKES
jgi:glycosyltransferase involved in cell wall biosynthesis